jgi:hypothetical protein
MYLFRTLSILILAGGLLIPCCCGNSSSKTAGAADSSSVAGGTDSTGAVILPANLERSGSAMLLRYKFVKGDKFGLEITTIENVKLTRDTTTQQNKQTLTYRYVFEVIEALPDGAARLKATCLRVKFDGDYSDVRGRKKMSYDTDEKNSTDKQKLFGQYIAQHRIGLILDIDAMGTIRKVGNVTEVIKQLLGRDYATTAAATKAQLENDYADNVLKNALQLAFQKFDEAPVAVDSSWSIGWTGPIGWMQLRHNAVYTLKGFAQESEGRVAYVVVNLKSEYVGGKTVDTGEGTATIQQFDVGGSGSTRFNMDRGICLDRRMKQHIFARFFIEPPEELKKMAPDQAKNFSMTQDAIIENHISYFTP